MKYYTPVEKNTNHAVANDGFMSIRNMTYKKGQTYATKHKLAAFTYGFFVVSNSSDYSQFYDYDWIEVEVDIKGAFYLHSNKTVMRVTKITIL